MTKEQLELLIKNIQSTYEIENQKDIPLSLKRNKGYLSQIKSRKHIPPGFIELLKLKYPRAFQETDDGGDGGKNNYLVNGAGQPHDIEKVKNLNSNKNWWQLNPRLADCDFQTIAKGSSMAALIREGSIVIGKEIFEKDYIIMGEIYIIKTKDQEVIRYVNPHPEKEDYYLLHPYNQKAQDTILYKKRILNIYEYRGCFQFY